MILTILLITLIFSLLVFVHELGHFLMARRNNVIVEEFGFGFPPRLVGKRVGSTLYSLNAIPLGGFVRLAGEDSTDTAPHTFGAASIWVKTKVMLAGVLMNIILAYVLVLLLCFVGLPATFSSSFKLPAPSSATSKQVMVIDVDRAAPAAQAGIAKGDIIAKADGKALSSEEDLISFTKAQAGKTVTLSVIHSGSVRSVNVALRDQKAGAKQGYLGVAPLQVYSTRYGVRAVWVAASLIGQMLWLTAAGVVQLFFNLPALVVGVFHAGVPVAAESVAGPIGIFTALSNIRLLGWEYLLFFVTTISIALAVFNVLPVPVLDGGKLFLIWLQKLTKRTFAPETEAKIYMASMVALGILIVIISVFDIRRL